MYLKMLGGIFQNLGFEKSVIVVEVSGRFFYILSEDVAVEDDVVIVHA